MKKKKQITDKQRLGNALTYMGIVHAGALYFGAHFGACFESAKAAGSAFPLMDALEYVFSHMSKMPLSVWPTSLAIVAAFQLVGFIADALIYNDYLRVAGTVTDAHGDAAFEDDYQQYDKEFVLDPSVAVPEKIGKALDFFAPFNEEHKRILNKFPSKEIESEIHKCRGFRSQWCRKEQILSYPKCTSSKLIFCNHRSFRRCDGAGGGFLGETRVYHQVLQYKPYGRKLSVQSSALYS